MQFKVGDIVRFVHEEGEGIIRSIDGIKANVETSDGFEMEYPLKHLVPKTSSEEYVVEDELINQKEGRNAFEIKALQLDKKFNHIKTKSVDTLEIDLHIESLIDSHRGMQNYQILEVQMSNFRRSLNIALSRRLKKLVLIHGVGEGVLREEIRKELKEYYPNFDFQDASYQVYGYGATEVILKYK